MLEEREIFLEFYIYIFEKCHDEFCQEIYTKDWYIFSKNPYRIKLTKIKHWNVIADTRPITNYGARQDP